MTLTDPRPRVEEHSASTSAWLEGSDPSERKRLGQYMTPRVVRERLLDKLDLAPGMRVLDPGVGTGELLRSALDREPGLVAEGWDVDPSVVEHARALVPEARLELRSALDPFPREPFDLVVGNPPYVQVRADRALRDRFGGVISGRPNAFALFFQAGLEALREGGRLAYVVPPSMNHGAYFEALRSHIAAVSGIEALEVLEGTDRFDSATTAVQLIVLRKGAPGGHVARFACAEAGFARTVFCEDPDRLGAAFAGRRTLWELGYLARTGTVVWNRCREELCEREEPGSVPLIWAANLREDGIALDGRGRRPQYVRGQRPLAGPAIVVNRVVGAVGRGSLKCGLVPEGRRFVGENHVNVITARKGASRHVSWEGLERMLRDPEVAERVRLLTGNTQLSASELNHLLPLG